MCNTADGGKEREGKEGFGLEMSDNLLSADNSASAPAQEQEHPPSITASTSTTVINDLEGEEQEPGYTYALSQAEGVEVEVEGEARALRTDRVILAFRSGNVAWEQYCMYVR